MASISTSFINRRTRTTFFTSMLVISLVLLLLGLFFSFALFSRVEFKNAKSTLEMRIVLPAGLTASRRDSLHEFLKSREYTMAVRYVTKEEAAASFAELIGENFTELTDGVNPLPASFNVKLKPEYVNPAAIEKISKQLERPDVERVSYPTERMETWRKNSERYMRTAIIAGIFIFLVAFFIIHSTIRLAIFSKRLVIRSMQLIGATSSFIRRPFVRMGTLQGFAAGVLACMMLSALIYFGAPVIQSFGIGDPTQLLYEQEFHLLLGGIVIIGALLGWFSSRFAVNRFLNRSLDELA